MFVPFNNNPENLIFASSSYTVPAGKFAQCFPLLINSQILNTPSPSPNNCSINSQIVSRRATVSALSFETYTVPAGVWDVYYSRGAPSSSDAYLDPENVGGREAIPTGGFLPLNGGTTTNNNTQLERRLSIINKDKSEDFFYVTSGNVLSGSGTFLWMIVLYSEYA